MKAVFDGSVCFDRFGACFDYYTQVVPRLVEAGWDVTVTPSPTGALDCLSGSGAAVTRTVLPSGAWMPQGRLRRFLSQQKQRVESWRWNRRLDDKEPIIYHSFFYGLPARADLIYVPMVLDMIAEKFPDLYSNQDLQVAKARAVARADRVITISEMARQDILVHYGVAPELVDVVHLGVNPIFQPGERNTIRPYFLQVGGRSAHKNFERLLQAYARYAASGECDLVCAGERWTEAERAQIETFRLSSRVRLVQKPDLAALSQLYQGATALVYPSLYEGFGIPPIEAMAAGVPVGASSGGAIPEIVGDAALLFDPFSIEAIEAVLKKLAQPEIRSDLIRKGAQRVAHFKWDRVAGEVAAVFLKSLGLKFLPGQSIRYSERTELK